MNFRDLIQKRLDECSVGFSSGKVRRKQLLLLGGVVILAGLGLGSVLLLRSEGKDSNNTARKPVEMTPKTIATPLESVNEREIWVNRVEANAKQVQEEAEKFRKENEILEKRIDILEELLNERKLDQKIADEEAEKRFRTAIEENVNTPQQFSGLDSGVHELSPTATNSMMEPSPKLGHISRSNMGTGALVKTVDTYLPAATTCKAVMTSGVVASTGSESRSNPKPVTLRLVDDGKLPRGFTSRVKGAEINAACYGDISTERVECRLVSMTWVEPNGTIVERNVEGWIYGEDGSEGLRGKIVDRSGDIAREAYFAGVLSGFSNFFKFEALSSVFPASPFGITNALNTGNAVQGAAASGVSNAMEKLADRSIKRLDQMQPVIVITGGRVVDVRFKSGVSLVPDQSAEMKVIGTQDGDER